MSTGQTTDSMSNPVYMFIILTFELSVTVDNALVAVVLSVTFKPLELCSATVAIFGTSQANCLL